MVLTSQRSNRDPDKFPTVQLFLLGMWYLLRHRHRPPSRLPNSIEQSNFHLQDNSYCPPRRTNRPHFNLPICLATRQALPRRRRERCLLLRRTPHICLCSCRVPNWNVLGRLVRQGWTETSVAHGMSWYSHVFNCGGLCSEYVGGAGRKGDGGFLEWEHWGHTNDGCGIGYEA
jgi:hypothetical protein